MADDKKAGPQDRTRINVKEPYELAYWRKKFGCRTVRLVAAVKAVGVMAADVREHLKKKPKKKNKAAKKRKAARKKKSR